MKNQISQISSVGSYSGTPAVAVECWFSGFLVGVGVQPKRLCSCAVRSICPGGWGFTVVTLETGSQLCVGDLSDSYRHGQEGSPQLDRLVASGWNHTVVISRDCNTVFQSGSCAAVPGDGVLHTPLQAVVFGENVALCSIAAGEQHSIAVDRNGDVWAWGRNPDGQLGVEGIADSQLQAQQVARDTINTSALGASETFFQKVACGARHSCALTRSGRLFCWGSNLHDQCGVLPDAGTYVHRPMPVTSLDGLRVISVAAGLSHTVVCTDAGAVYTWGWNRDGQLGHGPDQPSCRRARLVEAPALADVHVVKVCSGSRHCAALTKDAEVYTWGWNAFGQLGSGSKASSFEPVHVSGLPAKVHDIECGWWHTLFLVIR
ncbi:g8992 [Coccomyxa elongata]